MKGGMDGHFDSCVRTVISCSILLGLYLDVAGDAATYAHESLRNEQLVHTESLA